MNKSASYSQLTRIQLDHLLESTVDGGADVRHVLPEVDGGNSALADALGGELEFL